MHAFAESVLTQGETRAPHDQTEADLHRIHMIPWDFVSRMPRAAQRDLLTYIQYKTNTDRGVIIINLQHGLGQ